MSDVSHTEEPPPKSGRIIREIIGCSKKRRNAESPIVMT